MEVRRQGERIGALDDPEEILENYNPFAGRTERETAEWWLFVTFLTCDFAARRTGMKPKDAWQHVEHLLQESFQNVCSNGLARKARNFASSAGRGSRASNSSRTGKPSLPSTAASHRPRRGAKPKPWQSASSKTRPQAVSSAMPPRSIQGS